jgi:7-cyano-7-deazaguanine synthase in queuosine biosynthesis
LYEEFAIGNTIPETNFDTVFDFSKWEEKDAHIPGRNGFLVLAAAVKYKPDEVILVCQADEMSIPDRSPEFFTSISYLASLLSEKPVKVWTPFENMTKTEMVTWYLKQGLPVEDLRRTRSCYGVTAIPCGNCSACFRRWVAFTNNGIREKTLEEVPLSITSREHAEKLQRGVYSERRINETLEAFRRWNER